MNAVQSMREIFAGRSKIGNRKGQPAEVTSQLPKVALHANGGGATVVIAGCVVLVGAMVSGGDGDVTGAGGIVGIKHHAVSQEKQCKSRGRMSIGLA